VASFSLTHPFADCLEEMQIVRNKEIQMAAYYAAIFNAPKILTLYFLILK
jgi:hypothetical protein